MAKDRKTISIDALLDYANGYLSADYPNCDAPEEIARRNGLIDMIEAALHAVGRYRGYSYLDQKQILQGKPGIRWFEDGSHAFFDTDKTRRRYA